MFLHPQLAQIKHDHRAADCELVKPVIEIAGYPVAMELAPPTPALALAKAKTEVARYVQLRLAAIKHDRRSLELAGVGWRPIGLDLPIGLSTAADELIE